jgi:hypothetical protein
MSEKSLIPKSKIKPLDVFVKGGYKDILKEIRKKATIENPSVEKKKDRDLIIATAAKVASSKTLLETIGKTLADKKRSEIEVELSAINTARKEIKTELDELKKEVRKPVTEWEEKEKVRKEEEALKLQIAKDHESALELNVIFDEKREIAKENARIEEEKIKLEAEKKTAQQSTASTSEAVSTALKNQGAAEAETLRIKEKALDDAATSRQQALKIIGVDLDWQTLRGMADNEWIEFFEIKNKEHQSEQNRKAIEDENRKKQEAADKRAADVEHRKKINNEALSALVPILDGFDFEHIEPEDIGKEIIVAIIQGKVPHVSIKY